MYGKICAILCIETSGHLLKRHFEECAWICLLRIAHRSLIYVTPVNLTYHQNQVRSPTFQVLWLNRMKLTL